MNQIAEIYEEEIDTLEDKYLTFYVKDEVYGIETLHVIEIVSMQPITKLPETPDHICGIINLRGKVFPVIDTQMRFQKSVVQHTDRTCIIIVEIDDTMIGLMVSGVSDVLSIDPKSIEPPPSATMGLNNSYIKGIGKVGDQIMLLIDCQKLLINE
jgi:purine-binding chemotaxis protein CheW